jgi:hypothetical protein
MNQQHERTLQALFAHPLHHDLRVADVEALLLHLGIHVEHRSDHRVNLEAPSGATVVVHAASGKHHPFLNEEGTLRLRRFLKQEGITPEHPIANAPHPRGDQAKRLVVHLDHRGARLWWLKGNEINTSTLQPHGLWSSHQHLSHRHDRDIAGQRAPVDFEFLNELSQAILEADRVLLLGHGHGESDVRKLIHKHMDQHHPGASARMETRTVNDTGCSDAELIAIARAHFGNLPHRSHPRGKSRESNI